MRDKGALVLSNDDFFTDAKTGEYKFDRPKLESAIKSCRFNTALAMKQSVPWIVIDNCFIYRSGIEWYKNLAFRHGYEVEVKVVGKLDDESVRSYAARNVHNVPFPAIADMAAHFESEPLR